MRAGLAVILALLGVCASGCGSSSTPGVARAPTGTSVTPSAARESPMAQAVRWADCMRSHGLSSFPDPTAVSGGGVHFDVPPAMATSAAYGAAMRACVKFQPAPTAPSGAQLAQLIGKLRAFAACMRRHGLSNFPDPTAQGHFDLAGTGLSKTSPGVVAAGKVCLTATGIGP